MEAVPRLEGLNIIGGPAGSCISCASCSSCGGVEHHRRQTGGAVLGLEGAVPGLLLLQPSCGGQHGGRAGRGPAVGQQRARGRDLVWLRHPRLRQHVHVASAGAARGQTRAEARRSCGRSPSSWCRPRSWTSCSRLRGGEGGVHGWRRSGSGLALVLVEVDPPPLGLVKHYPLVLVIRQVHVAPTRDLGEHAAEKTLLLRLSFILLLVLFLLLRGFGRRFLRGWWRLGLRGWRGCRGLKAAVVGGGAGRGRRLLRALGGLSAARLRGPPAGGGLQRPLAGQGALPGGALLGDGG